MQYSTYLFILAALPLTVCAYFLFARLGQRAANLFLIGASLALYAWGGWKSLACLCAGIGVNIALLKAMKRWETPGLGSLDDYSAWGPEIYGKSVAVRRDAPYAETRQQALTEERREKVRCNVREKVVALAQEHPDTTFYCFLTPYSAAWWGDLWEEGQLEAQLEMEEIVIRAILPCKNIRLFSWNTVKELTTDLANYKDRIHYGPWVNDWMLEQMASGKGMLTEENVQAYLDEERDLYVNFDYNSLFDQEDPTDYIAPAFFRQ